jgi:hypothetical protein
MIFIVLGSVAAFFLFLCVGCAWYERRSQNRRGKTWFSQRHDWWDTNHVLDTPASESFWDIGGGGDGGFCGGDGGGDGGCGGDGGGGGD